MSPSHSIADRDEVLRELKRAGPSTVTELMRAVAPELGARRHYRQLLRVLVREGAVVLDRKGRLSIPRAEAAEAPGRGGREPRVAGASAGRDGGRGRGGRDAPDWSSDEAPPGQVASGRHVRAGRSGRSIRGGPDRDRGSESGEQAARAGANVARFEGHRSGFGFVNPTDGSRDVFIPPHRTGGALHGDLVEYQVLGSRPDGRREGTVVRVAGERGQRVVGLVTRVAPVVEVVPFDARAGARFVLVPGAGAFEGVDEGVAVEIEIPRRGGTAPARLLDVLGPIDRPGVDIEILIRKHALRCAFPDAVLRAAEAFGGEIDEEEMERREDFSRQMVLTIDGDTAKDFDDAISVTRTPAGGYELGVHIADVAHYVTPGGAIDVEARLRGTSVYFPGRAIPMLPPALSENLCSLKPDASRLVQSVVIRFDAKGEVKSARFADGWIRSRARLTYGRVNALLRGAPPDNLLERALAPDLAAMQDLAARLSEKRSARGGLDFDLPEPEVVLDALGAAAGVRPASRGPAQRLIEEFMIVANVAVAAHVAAAESPTLYRVHERPDAMKVREFARTLAAFGYKLDADPDGVEPLDFRGVLDQIGGRPEERVLGRLLLRTMALARYAPEPLGHFGLAAPDYLHFTSPIRRYPDLVAHRALRVSRRGAAKVRAAGAGRRALRPKRTQSSRADLDAVAHENLVVLGAECSRLERVAEAAERESLAWKRAEVLMGRVGDEMDGTISSVTPLGLFVELEEVFAEGLLPLAALPGERHVYDALRLEMHDEHSGRSYRAGQPLRVLVARVDRIVQRVELALPGQPYGNIPSKSAHRADAGPDRDASHRAGKRKGPWARGHEPKRRKTRSR